MKIRVSYAFYTDGDYSLQEPEKFGCTGQEVEIEEDFYDYVGVVEFETIDIVRCKMDAKDFLERLLCDGIHVSSSHYWLLKDFYDIIDGLMNFINHNNSGECYDTIGGNQDGTVIKVEIFE